MLRWTISASTTAAAATAAGTYREVRLFQQPVWANNLSAKATTHDKPVETKQHQQVSFGAALSIENQCGINLGLLAQQQWLSDSTVQPIIPLITAHYQPAAAYTVQATSTAVDWLVVEPEC